MNGQIGLQPDLNLIRDVRLLPTAPRAMRCISGRRLFSAQMEQSRSPSDTVEDYFCVKHNKKKGSVIVGCFKTVVNHELTGGSEDLAA